MSDNDKSSINWGSLAKTILAGAAIVVGVELIAPGTLFSLMPSISAGGGEGMFSGMFSEGSMKGIGEVVRMIAGAVIAGTGLSYIFSDKSQTENTERHTDRYNEAKESFAIREDMRKMQTVMMARMKAAGHEPAMAAAAAGPQVG